MYYRAVARRIGNHLLHRRFVSYIILEWSPGEFFFGYVSVFLQEKLLRPESSPQSRLSGYCSSNASLT